ncbi:MAG: flagellar hook-associated protein FlgL [Halioglobus sp.]
MRVSTAQIFQQGVTAILNQQAQLNKTQEQLATGRRVLSPADDPVAALQVLDITEGLQRIEQYERNANLAQGQLALSESTLGSVGTLIQRVRELVVQANNASQGPDTRAAIATEIDGRMDELRSLANTRDSNGEYIFAGFQAQEQPFSVEAGATVFNGDTGQRFLQLGASTQVAVRDSGAEIFMRVPSGNGVYTLAPSPSNAGSAVANEEATSGNFVRDTYSVNFIQATPTDPVTYEVIDSGPSVVATGTYQSGDIISFAGANVRFEGAPEDGDSFVVAPSSNQDIFATMQSIVDSLNNTTGDPASVAQLNTSMGQALENLDRAFDRVLEVRADVGVRQQRADSQLEINDSFNLQLQETLSEVQDLDYAEAISRFNLELTALQAAQQAYVQMQGLSLFDYL